MSSQSHWLPENTATWARGVSGLRAPTSQPDPGILPTWSLGSGPVPEVKAGQLQSAPGEDGAGGAPTELPLSRWAWLPTLCSEEA